MDKKKELKTEEEKIEDATSDKANLWKGTPEEVESTQMVYERFRSMRDSQDRQDSSEDWDDADKEYRIFIEARDSDDNRANINKPISFAIIETEMQETIDRKPRPVVRPREHSDIGGANMVNEVLKHSFDKGDFDYQYFLARKESKKYGTAVLYEYYREDKRTVKELELKKDDKTGEVTEDYKDVERIDYEDCYAQYEPLRMWYFDAAGNHIDKCRDAIRREILNINEYRRIYGNKRGFKNQEFAVAGGDTSVDSYYDVPSDVLQGEEIEILHYWNRALDQYYVVANGVIIRELPNPNKHKEIPAIVIYCYKDPNKFYGIGLPKILKPLNDERNTLSNLRIDYQKMGINKMFFYDDMIELDEMDLVARPFGGIPINAQGRSIDQVVKWIEYGDVKPSTFKEEEVLSEDIRRTVGVDDRVQGVNAGGTATEAAILKESSMKRINMKETLAEIDSMVRLGRLRLANISFFYPIPKIERIMKNNKELKENKKYKVVRVDGKSFKINDKGELQMDTIDDYSFIKIDEKMGKYFDIEYDIIVNAEASTPISKPLMQGKISEMLDRLTTNPAMLSLMDGKKSASRYITINDESPEDWLKDGEDNTADMEELADMENEVMLRGGQPLISTKGATEAHTRVHLNITKTPIFLEADERAKQMFEQHVKGEATAQGINVPQGQVGGGGAATSPMGGGGGMASQLPDPSMNSADVTPAAINGGE